MRVPAIDDLLDVEHNLVGVLGHAGQHVRLGDAHGAHVLHKLSLERVREVEVGGLDGPFGGERRGEGSGGGDWR